MKNTFLIIAVIGLVVSGLYFFTVDDRNSAKVVEKMPDAFGTGQKVTVYKDPNCGCCVGYADELKRQGFDVETVSTKDMADIKDKYNIPADKQSCHTIAMDNYFIEGHVPMEAVEKLLKERPDIAGIGLPRMPSGTPGMPGAKRAPYEVYKQNGGEFSEFITI